MSPEIAILQNVKCVHLIPLRRAAAASTISWKEKNKAIKDNYFLCAAHNSTAGTFNIKILLH